jgi:palmitoyltransferase
VGFCCLLIGGIVFVHYTLVVPSYTSYWTLAGVLHFVISTFVTINIAYNYYKAVTTPPGSPPETQLTAEELEKLRHEPTPHRGQGFSRFCKVCKNLKCPRAHHCHVCQRCVLKMDHHCPWVHNCVGFHNHRYFVLFLLYAWLGCCYTEIMAVVPFAQSTNFHIPWGGILPRGAMIISFLVTLGVILGVGILLFWQVYLLLTGQTTIEFHYNQMQKWRAKRHGEVFTNPYHLGISRNFQLFFGTDNSRWWFSWLLPGGTKISGDGIRFPTVYDMRENEPRHVV